MTYDPAAQILGYNPWTYANGVSTISNNALQSAGYAPSTTTMGGAGGQWYSGTAYDPTMNYGANGYSQISDGVQLVPGAAGYNPATGVPAAQSAVSAWQNALAKYNNAVSTGKPETAPPPQANSGGGLGGLGNWNTGNWGSQTSPVYRPSQPNGPQPTNGYSTWGNANPFSAPTF